MRHLSAVVLSAAVVCPSLASAAEVTRLASSFEEEKPLGLFLDVDFERTQTRSKIVREATQDSGGYHVEDVAEAWYRKIDSRLNFDLRVGLYRDVEFRAGVPLVFQQDETWDFVKGNSPANSTIFSNQLCANGQTGPGCAQPLFAIPTSTYRGGLGNLRFGLSWAVFNQVRDETKPTWVLGFDYEAPTAERLDPSLPTSPDARGGFGDRNHRYTFSTALSRRIGVADPYFRASYTVPVRGPGAYSNCEHPDARSMAVPENCGKGPWSRDETGIHAPQTAAVLFGTELHAYDNPKKQQGFFIDLHGSARYVGPGRYYNALSGALGKLLSTEDYLLIGGGVGLNAKPADFFRLFATTNVSYATEHLLTAESVGQDVNGNGAVDLPDFSNPADPNRIEVNPNYDLRVDSPSHRFRASEMSVFELRLGAEFSF